MEYVLKEQERQTAMMDGAVTRQLETTPLIKEIDRSLEEHRRQTEQAGHRP
jgi:hypothetical protein